MFASEVISWIIIIAFAVLLTVTILGMIGVITFKQKSHLNKLFTVLILEVIAMAFLIFRKGQAEGQWDVIAQQKYEKALAYFEGQDYEKSLLSADSVLYLKRDEGDFSLSKVFLLKGNIAFETQQWFEAIENYKTYLKIDPNNIDVMSNLGRSYRAVFKYKEAVEVYHRAVALKPSDYQIKSGYFNCLRRYAGFMADSQQNTYANQLFREAKILVLEMIEIARSQSIEPSENRKLLNALVAQSRLNWEWKRYDEAMSLMKQIAIDFPDFGPNLEDLAAIQLEIGQEQNDQGYIRGSLTLYKSLLESNSMDEISLIYIRSGIAEATALISHPSSEELDFALTGVNLAIAQSDKVDDDPYAFYAKALVLHRMGKIVGARDYLAKAIMLEKKRSSNPYAFDFERLVKYELLLNSWLT